MSSVQSQMNALNSDSSNADQSLNSNAGANAGAAQAPVAQ